MTFIRYAKNQKIGKTNDFKVLGEIKPKGLTGYSKSSKVTYD